MALLGPHVAGTAARPMLPLRLTWDLIAYTIAAAASAEDDTAHAALERALDLAAADLLRRPFLEEAPRLAPLLREHLTATKHGSFVQDLLGRFDAGGCPPNPEARLRAQLTERERAVLGLLPSGMTAGEIASTLSVSEATVRTHLRHVYEKLGVAGRREAVRRAGELRYVGQDPDLNLYKKASED
jgi:LuxR family maltose regulon positive regulatory protein